MTVVLTPTAEYNVPTRDGLWMSAADAEKVTGWTLKPEGMCRDELCVPLPPAAVKGGDVDVEAFWQKLGGPVIASRGRRRRGRWAHRPTSAMRLSRVCRRRTSPCRMSTASRARLSQLRGKKVFLATWASW